MNATKPKMTLQVKKRTPVEGLIDEKIEEFGNQAEAEVKKSKAKQSLEIEKAVAKKVVRDSFSMPEEDYALIARMREKALKNQLAVTKAEVIRAGLHLLNKLDDSALTSTFRALEKVKTGRPKQ